VFWDLPVIKVESHGPDYEGCTVALTSGEARVLANKPAENA